MGPGQLVTAKRGGWEGETSKGFVAVGLGGKGGTWGNTKPSG